MLLIYMLFWLSSFSYHGRQSWWLLKWFQIFSQITCNILGVSEEDCSMLLHVAVFAEVSGAGGGRATILVVQWTSVPYFSIIQRLTRLIRTMRPTHVIRLRSCHLFFMLTYQIIPYGMIRIFDLYNNQIIVLHVSHFRFPTKFKHVEKYMSVCRKQTC